jgi:flagellar biosynthesis/type III secretory pathway protein FliH
MIRRFVPPAVASFASGTLSDAARALAAAREDSFLEGQKAGRQDGHATGLREGKAQARAANEAEMASLRAEFARHHTIHTVAEALQRLADMRESTRQDLETQARFMIESALRALFPLLLTRTAGAEILALIAEPLAERGNEGITLRAHPETVAAVHAQGITDLEPALLTLIADPALAPGAVAATWGSGGMTFDPAVMLEQVADILSSKRNDDKELIA